MEKMKEINDLDNIFSLLKDELQKYQRPLITHEKWDKINKTPFTTLISCILSLRTKDEVTDKASIRLLKNFDTPEKILKISEEGLQELIYPVGFYRIKSKTIRDVSKTIIKKYNGKVPDTIDELLKLKGVGRKTANIVMVYGHNRSGFLPIDTHCHRIPNRLGWIKTKTPEETEIELKKLLPEKYWDDFNHLFVTFGQNICLPVSPLCSKCPIENFCKKINVQKSR